MGLLGHNTRPFAPPFSVCDRDTLAMAFGLEIAEEEFTAAAVGGCGTRLHDNYGLLGLPISSCDPFSNASFLGIPTRPCLEEGNHSVGSSFWTSEGAWQGFSLGALSLSTGLSSLYFGGVCFLARGWLVCLSPACSFDKSNKAKRCPQEARNSNLNCSHNLRSGACATKAGSLA